MAKGLNAFAGLLISVVLAVAWRSPDAMAAQAPASPTTSSPTNAAAEPTQLQFTVIKTGSRNSLLVSGPIVAGDYARFRDALTQSGNIDEVVLQDSPGGNVMEALDIARMIRSRSLATHIPDGGYCASACNYLFIGGQVRTIDTSGVFRVHMFTDVDTEMDDLAKATTDEQRKAAVQAIEETSAIIAASVARFLIEMQISLKFLTEEADIPNAAPQILSREKLREYNIINTD